MSDTQKGQGGQSGTMSGSGGSGSTSGSQDWNTKDPQQFLSRFRDVIGHAKNAGVSQQHLRDSIDQSYSGTGGSGGSSGGGSSSGGASSTR